VKPLLDDIIQLTNELHQDTDALLVESVLLGRLAPYGQEVLTGSYCYRLMTEPAITILYIGRNDRET